MFLINPTTSPVNNKNNSTHFFKNKSKETILYENATSKGSFNASDSCISFVMRSPIFGGNDSVEEINNMGSSNKITQKSNHDNENHTYQKHNLIKRNNSHFNTIMSKLSDANMDEISQKKIIKK